MNVRPLLSPRAVLRPLAEQDAEALHAAYGDPEACRYWWRDAYATLEETREAVAWEIEHGASWALLEHLSRPEAPGDVVGRASLFLRRDGVLEAAIILAKSAWGRGIASDALHAIVRYGFEDLDAHRIFADVDPDNVASLRLFERAGFVREGLLRQAWRSHIGLRDSVILGRLRGDVA